MGELDGVAQQVGQYLLEAQGIATQAERHVTVDQADQLNLFLVRRRCQHGQGFLDQIAQVERQVVEHQLARLDLREVENLVDDVLQALGRFADGVQVFDLARGHFGALQQVAEAEDTVERRAQLMTHVGEKLGFDSAGLLGSLARHVQFDVLYFNGFQRLAQVFGGLFDVLLQLALGALQCLGHGVDTLGQIVEFACALTRQAHVQLALADAGNRLVDFDHRVDDMAPHGADHQAGDQQAEQDQYQRRQQRLITAQLGIAVAQLYLKPANQRVGLQVTALGRAKQLGAGLQRQDKTGAALAGAHLQAGTSGQRAFRQSAIGCEHLRAAVFQRLIVGVVQGDRAHVLVIQGVGQGGAHALWLPGQQGLGGGALQMLGGELAAFKQLLLQITQVLPAEVDAHCGGQYPGRDQGHQQESGLDTNVVHVNVFPFPRQPCIQGRREIRTWVGQITSLSVS